MLVGGRQLEVQGAQASGTADRCPTRTKSPLLQAQAQAIRLTLNERRTLDAVLVSAVGRYRGCDVGIKRLLIVLRASVMVAGRRRPILNPWARSSGVQCHSLC